MRDQDLAPIPLSDATLSEIPNDIERPTYDRSALSPGIVHIGLGNFHRAHQAWYVHRLMQKGQALDWAIIGASVRAEDTPQKQRLAQQDFLTTLIELDPSGTSAEIIGSMIDYLPIEEGHAPLIACMSDPKIRIVSLTVTEGGYFLDPATKTFDPAAPDIVHDAGSLITPRTAFGAMVAALKARRANGTSPFTCQSCDNLPGNGDILRSVVVGLAELADPDLAWWITEHVSFPNSMVDCIVPTTGHDELALSEELGIADRAPVTHENFRQWVIEDNFCAGRPPWESVGAIFSDRVHDFEAMKLRILNGGHQMVANPAEILGLSTIAESMAHPLIEGMFRKVCLEEVVPHVRDVPGMTPADYVSLISKRFANPAIRDTVRRVAFDGSSRHTGAVLPIIRDAIFGDTPLSGLALSQALWAWMCIGVREDQSVIEANDPIWDELNACATTAKDRPISWLEQQQIYGEISEDAAFCSRFEHWFNSLKNHGVDHTLRAYLNDA
ncbi:MAG: mannitol dehydrogenase family protein [Marinovum sp.]|nr:mannitol dehydrogenase family protein [Marinovum sp.]